MTPNDPTQNVAFEEVKQSATVETRKKDIDAIYDIPVQISAVLGKSTMQVSQLLKLGRGAVVELDRKVRGHRYLRQQPPRRTRRGDRRRRPSRRDDDRDREIGQTSIKKE